MTIVAPAPGATTVELHAPRWKAWLARPALMCLLLIAAYGALSSVNDPRAFLGTDTGGKVATLRAMDQRDDLDPDLGYWAARYDAEGMVHPIVLNFRVDGGFVNVTTLPMLYAAEPLYEAGGLRAILILPMLGGVATALGARALARRLGGNGDLAFWVVGLATPVVIYALDFWEHTLGLACMVWAVVLLVDVAEQRGGWRRALAGGALFGAAATMRTEALVYAVAAFAVLGAVTVAQRRRLPIREAVATLAGLGAVLVVNQVLERIALGGGLRADRASGAAERVGAEVTTRGRDALITTVGLNRFAPTTDWFLGVCIVGFIALAAVAFVRGRPNERRTAYLALGAAVVGYFVWLKQGLGFLPGFLTASPIAVAGLVCGWRNRRAWPVLAVAVVALPLVWAFQYSGGANPQWGGRYVLLTSTLLAIVGVVALGAAPRRALVAFVVLAASVTACGLVWLSERSTSVAVAAEQIDRIRGPVIVDQAPHFLREAGAFYNLDQPWLTAETGELPAAVEVVDRSGAERLTLVTLNRKPLTPQLGPFDRGQTRRIDLVLGVDLLLTPYDRRR